jgi:hypothetical protein
VNAECPVCGKDNAIQKVSAIVSSGFVTGTTVGPVVLGDDDIGIVVGSSSSTTNLAQLLSPPTKPRKTGNVSLALIVAGAFFLSFWLWAKALEILSLSGTIGLILTVLYLIAILVVALTVVARSITHSGRRFRDRMQAWETCMSVWMRLYYCHRDDVVFDPGSGVYASPYALGRILEQALSEQ